MCSKCLYGAGLDSSDLMGSLHGNGLDFESFRRACIDGHDDTNVHSEGVFC
jgi:hypothetical protein